MLTFLWLATVFVGRKSLSGTNVHSEQSSSTLLSAADAEVIHIPACRRLAQICWLSYFHMAVSSACLSALRSPTPQPPPPLFVIWDPRSTVPLALALNRFPRVTRPGQMASPEEGIGQTSSLQHRKQGLVLSYPPFPQEMVIEMFLRELRGGERKDR